MLPDCIPVALAANLRLMLYIYSVAAAVLPSPLHHSVMPHSVQVTVFVFAVLMRYSVKDYGTTQSVMLCSD